MSRNSPAPRGFRGTPTCSVSDRTSLDGRHFTSFACSDQRTELRCPLEGFLFLLRGPSPPTSFSPCGLKYRWQVLRELRVILCQRFFSYQGQKGKSNTYAQHWRHLSTNFVVRVITYQPLSRIFSTVMRRRHVLAGEPFSASLVRRGPPRGELRSCNLLEPASVRVAPAPQRAATNRARVTTICDAALTCAPRRPPRRRAILTIVDSIEIHATLSSWQRSGERIRSTRARSSRRKVERHPRVEDDCRDVLVAQGERSSSRSSRVPRSTGRGRPRVTRRHNGVEALVTSALLRATDTLSATVDHHRHRDQAAGDRCRCARRLRAADARDRSG